MLAIAGWGWHAEVAVHILRLALSGALDRHPRLKLLIGHMGECLPTMMDRVERVFSGYSNTHLERNAARAIVEQVWVSTSGFSSTPAFLAASRAAANDGNLTTDLADSGLILTCALHRGVIVIARLRWRMPGSCLDM
jgi:hypothetical protein